MADTAEELFEDETVAGDEAAVDEMILAAGGKRAAVRRLLAEVDQLYRALAWAEKSTSLGYRRLRQPPRPVI
jgi:maltooligosyltrehalose synthase